MSTTDDDRARERAARGIDDEPDYTVEPLDDAPDGNPFALAPLEVPQRVTGWRHLPPERWTPDRIHVAPYNAKIRRLSDRQRDRLRRGLVKFGWAGTFIVRAEDGLLIGGAQRYALALEAIAENAGNMPELERLNLAGVHTGDGAGWRKGLNGVSLAVSPVLGIPDADALALNVLLNNREAQGEFTPMGLAEALSELDAHGFDVTETGYDIEQVAALVTWEPDETKQGGAKSAGAEPATKLAAKQDTPPALVLPCTRADVDRALGWLARLKDETETDGADDDAAARLERLLELPPDVLPVEPPLDFGAHDVQPSRTIVGRNEREAIMRAQSVGTPVPAPGTPSTPPAPDVTRTPGDVPRDTPPDHVTALGVKIWQKKG